METEPRNSAQGTLRKLQERGVEAVALTAPFSRQLDAIEKAGKALKTNADRIKNVKLEPKWNATDVIEGPFDWLEFYVFCVVILDYTEMRPQPHDEICQGIAALFPDLTFKGKEQYFGLTLVPRSCFKSVIFSVALPLYLLWKNPNSRGLLSSHRHDAAKAYLRTVKWHIENTQKYIELCGNLKPASKNTKWADDAIIISTRTKASIDPSLDTAGVDRSKVGAHPDWIICDDLHSERNVETALMRNKVYDHIVAFYPMLQTGGGMAIVGTRWHMQDAYGKLIQEDLDAVAQEIEPQYRKIIRSAYIDGPPGKPKQLYFPERLDEAFLDKARHKYKKMFSLWFLNQAIADSDKLFPKEELANLTMQFLYDEGLGLPTITLSTGIESIPVSTLLTWDPAGINPSDKSDFHGFSVVCTDPHDRMLIPKSEAIKAKPDEILRRVVGYIVMYEPENIILENTGQSAVWAYMLQQHCRAIGQYCPPIILFTPSNKMDKFSRITARLQPKWANHEILVDRRCRELIDQFDNFPQLDFDDLIDSVQMSIDYNHRPDTDEQYLMEANAYFTSGPNLRRVDPRSKMGSFAGLSASRWGSAPLVDLDSL